MNRSHLFFILLSCSVQACMRTKIPDNVVTTTASSVTTTTTATDTTTTIEPTTTTVEPTTTTTEPTTTVTEPPPVCDRANPSDVQVYVEMSDIAITGTSEPIHSCMCSSDRPGMMYNFPANTDSAKVEYGPPLGSGMTYTCDNTYYISDGENCYRSQGTIKSITIANYCPAGTTTEGVCKPKAIVTTNTAGVVLVSDTKPPYSVDAAGFFAPLSDENAYLTATMVSCDRCPEPLKTCMASVPNPKGGK
ncbi:hypothetical protein QR680_004787 [Steinernema hermaphroditum]|uniref:Uncharacterized protein n=1 Tax=Steinernema hermaphroditum TaxID=289476 RepID=A0AA39HR00_9BILA|nr:hypothetical protein QR680_004787 [Steinernema hermaphroditum]